MSAEVKVAYAGRAADYIARFGSIKSTHPADRKLIAGWAATIVGPILDAGCGPGQWSKFLRDQGADVEGIDVVPEFVEYARANFPGIPFRVASFEDLGVPPGHASGILAWYSLIHCPPDELAVVLQELATCLAPGGGLLVGMFGGSKLEEFQHAVAPAYWWPLEDFIAMLARAGFEVVSYERRADTGQRPHVAISARLKRS